MAIFTFENPKYLALILAIPLLLIIHFYSLRQHNKKALKFANFDAISRISGIQFFSKNLTVLYLSLIIVITLSLGAAGTHVALVKQASSFTFVIGIDTSQSMETRDLPGNTNRIAAAREAASEFINAAPSTTKIGIITFSGLPLIEQGITTNKNALKTALERIQVNRVGGTNIMNAVITASTMYGSESEKALIIISDGQISVDTIETIIKYALQQEITINTIGIGTIEGGETPIGAISKLDEDALKALAFETEGNYARVTNTEEFNDAVGEILNLSKRRVNQDLTYFMIFLSAVLFITIFFLINTKYHNIP